MATSERAPEVVPAADVLAAIAEAVVYADRAGVIRAWNDGAAAIFGFTPEEALGQRLDLVVPERFRAAHWRAYDAAMERGATAGGREARLTRGTHRDPDRVLYVELSFAVVTGADGSASGAVAVARDVTERQLRERSDRKRSEATASQREGGRGGS